MGAGGGAGRRRGGRGGGGAAAERRLRWAQTESLRSPGGRALPGAASTPGRSERVGGRGDGFRGKSGESVFNNFFPRPRVRSRAGRLWLEGSHSPRVPGLRSAELVSGRTPSLLNHSAISWPLKGRPLVGSLGLSTWHPPHQRPPVGSSWLCSEAGGPAGKWT